MAGNNEVYVPGIYAPGIVGDESTAPRLRRTYALGVYAPGVYSATEEFPSLVTELVFRDELGLGEADYQIASLPEGAIVRFVSETDGVVVEDTSWPARLLVNGTATVRVQDGVSLEDQQWQRLARYDPVEPRPARVDTTVANFTVRFRTSPTTLVDVTNDVLSLSANRRVARTLDGLEAGTIDLLLENSDGKWSPLVPGAHGGGLRPGMGIEVLHTSAASGDLFLLDEDRLDQGRLVAPAFLFTGQVDKIQAQPSLSGPRTVTISGRDRVKELRRRRVNTDVMTNVNVGSAVTRVLDLAGVPTNARTVATIPDTWSLAWFNDRVLDTVLDEIIEAGGYGAYVSKDGKLVFEDKNFDIGRTVVGTVVAFNSLTYSIDDSRLINTARVTGSPRSIATSTQLVAALETPFTVPRGQSREFFLSYQDPRNQESVPAIGMQLPVAGTDWQLNTEDTGSGSGLTSQASLTITFFAESAKVRVHNGSTETGYLTRCNLFGKPVQRRSDVAHEAVDEESIATFGENSWSADSRLLSTLAEVRNRAEGMVREHGVPQGTLSMRLINQWPEQLDHDVAQVLHVVEPFLGVNDQYTIVDISHQIDAQDRGWVHATDYTLESARNFETLVLNSPTRGTLDFNRLGRVSSYVADNAPLLYSIVVRDGIAFGDQE